MSAWIRSVTGRAYHFRLRHTLADLPVPAFSVGKYDQVARQEGQPLAPHPLPTSWPIVADWPGASPEPHGSLPVAPLTPG